MRALFGFLLEKINNIMKKKINKKGFSLIELIISVAILAVIVVPLMRSFVSAGELSVKSQKTGEATDTAQNVLEALQSNGISSIIDNTQEADTLKSNLSAILGVNSGNVYITQGSADDKDGKILIKNIKNGSFTFNAEVTVTPGKEDADTEYYNLNNKEISTSDRNVADIYQQPSGKENPDVVAVYQESGAVDEQRTAALTAFKEVCPDNFYGETDEKYYDKNSTHRVIDINVVALGNDVKVTISYWYSFAYYIGEHTVQRVVFEVNQGAMNGSSDDGIPTFYIMYYPYDCYGHSSTGLNNEINKGTIKFQAQTDVINVSYEEDVKANIVLVKQWPLEALASDSSNINTRKDLSSTQYVDTYKQTKFLINETRYLDVGSGSLTNAQYLEAYEKTVGNEGAIYSNADKDLNTTDSIGLSNFHTVNVIDDKNSLTMQLSIDTHDADSLIKSSLNKTVKEERIFKIGIKIKDENENVLCTLDGSSSQSRSKSS